jgi:predicted DNA-binding transcriptional regulator YafY
MPPVYQPNRGELTERLIRILFLLAERPHSQRELAQLFDVDSVTIRRNLNELSRHYFILDEMEGREKIYRFGDNYEFRPPNLTPGELATLLLAQQAIDATGLTAFGTPFGHYGYTLLDKVRAALPRALRNKLDTLAHIFGSATIPAKDYSKFTEQIDRLTNAAMNSRRVRMRYRTLHSGQTKERLFEPYTVYFDPDGATLKVIGYDHERQAIIPFSVDHIEWLQETGEVFARPADFTLQEFLTKYCFNGIHGEPLRVQLRAYRTTARVFAERQFHPSQKIIEQTADSITIEMTVARGRGLERFILSWLPDVEVLAPAELHERIQAVIGESLTSSTG